MVALQGPEDLLALMVNAHVDHANCLCEQLNEKVVELVLGDVIGYQ